MVHIIEQLALTKSLIQKHTACTAVYLLFFVKNRTEITRWKYGDRTGKVILENFTSDEKE
jgi:hypothetical protein